MHSLALGTKLVQVENAYLKIIGTRKNFPTNNIAPRKKFGFEPTSFLGSFRREMVTLEFFLESVWIFSLESIFSLCPTCCVR